MNVKDLRFALRSYVNPEKALFLPRFFKTGPGEYGEGDVFIGVVVPDQRKVALQYRDLPLNLVEELLHSPIHEERLTALLILVAQFKIAPSEKKKVIYELYLRSTKWVNNWDLVDLSAREIVGAFLEDKGRAELKSLARSTSIWDRRIAIIATYHFIRRLDFVDTLHIAELLLHDKHDLIHKAVGWMLREVGNRDMAVEETFLDQHAKVMPRTMLRYAIEKMSPSRRARYMAK